MWFSLLDRVVFSVTSFVLHKIRVRAATFQLVSRGDRAIQVLLYFIRKKSAKIYYER